MVNNSSNLRFMLHVSDFHLNDNEADLKIAQAALNEIARKLHKEKIKIDYLIHTGDIIDSKHLHKMAYDHVCEKVEQGSYKQEGDFSFEAFCKTAGKEEKNEFNLKLFALTSAYFDKAHDVVSNFMSEINVAPGNVVICCGNHDAMQIAPLSPETPSCEKEVGNTNEAVSRSSRNTSAPKHEEPFYPFNKFTNGLKVSNSPIRCGNCSCENGSCEDDACNYGSPIESCSLDNLNFLILNTNWKNPKCVKAGNFCIHCQSTIDKIKNMLAATHNTAGEMNIVVAHKPIYEICEKCRLSYKNYRKTDFMSNLYDYLGENGIYLCGDKHTRSVVGASFHDVQHYISGEPLHVQNEETQDFEAEYNLLGIANGKLEMERKIHLWSKDGEHWTCDICPQDGTVSNLFDLSKNFISPASNDLLPATNSRNTWEALNQVLFSQEKADTNTKNPSIDKGLIHACEITKDKDIDQFFKAASKYRMNGKHDVKWEKTDITCTTTNADNIFVFVANRIVQRMGKSNRNVLNLRGKYSSGKSTFLGLLYIYLLRLYSIGKINFIPAYFSLENAEMLDKVRKSTTYYDAVKHTFDDFSREVQKIALKEHQPVCYILDRIDTQDCWSYSSEDSVGRGLLDILSQYDNAWFIFSFGDHNLPLFKNTMSTRIYSDDSDVLYFNPIDVTDTDFEDPDDNFSSFVYAFLRKKGFLSNLARFCSQINNASKINNAPKIDLTNFIPDGRHEDFQKAAANETKLESLLIELLIDSDFQKYYNKLLNSVCNLIRKFRRLDIDFGFMRQHYSFLTELTLVEGHPCIKNESLNVDQIYRYYIDRQYERCISRMGYGFVNYAPAMAFLFSYQGYTYERFRKIRDDKKLRERHDMKLIWDNEDKIYGAFMFIEKHQDSREYLTALYYHRELRYYAEHPQERISSDSILNEFITRNIAVLIRKLWIDTNKFIIVCNKLLLRDELSNCALSMLLYCLSHISIYEPKRIELLNQIRVRANRALTPLLESIPGQRMVSADTGKSIDDVLSEKFDEFWCVAGTDGKQKLDYFLDLSLLHTLTLYGAMGTNAHNLMLEKLSTIKAQEPPVNGSDKNGAEHEEEILPRKSSNFERYNRQHQMLYYQDLSIWGEHRKRHLDPGNDLIYKGLDFFNCLHYLSVKINDAFNSKNEYSLLIYDILTLCNLVESRLNPTSDIDYNIYENRISTKDDSYFYYSEGYGKSKYVLKYLDQTLDNARKFHCVGDNQTKYIEFVQKMIQTRKEEIEKSLPQTRQADGHS